MANCYAIEKPSVGQKCYDDVYGPMVWNDNTWELDSSNSANVFDAAGNWIGTSLSGLYRQDSRGASSGSWIERNWLPLMAVGALLLLLWLFSKK